jgi:hypothetical protein
MSNAKTKKSNRNRTNKSREPIIRHHVKRAIHATPKFVHGMIVGAFVGVMLVGVLRATSIANAQGASAPDCDANSVIWCGASSSSAVLKNYNDGDGHNKANTIQAIYAGFGIDRTDVQDMSSDSSSGYVTKTGLVYIGSREVAKNVITGGRQNISGSTKRNYGPQVYYSRPPSVSFEDSQLEALVVMKNNVFQFAILVSCGNPVTGTPTTSAPKPTPTPTPTPKPTPTPTPTPAPTPQPALVCSSLSLIDGKSEANGDWTYTLEGVATPTNGATITSYTFDFGDQETQTVDTSAHTALSSPHTYAPGTYTVKVTVNASNSLVSTCQRSFTANSPTPIPTTTVSTVTPTPTPIEATPVASLPNTGPGAVIIIAIASVVGGYVFHMGHRHIRNKRRGATHHTTHHHKPPHRPVHAH